MGTKTPSLPSPDEKNELVLKAPSTTAIAVADPAKLTGMALLASLQESEAVKNSKYAVCKPGSDMMEAMIANGMAGEKFNLSDLAQGKVPTAGGDKWIVRSVMGDENVKEIKGVLVYYGVSGVLWPYAKMKDGCMPVLVTNDMVNAIQLGEDFGELDQEAIEECFIGIVDGKKTYNWQKLPYNQWGSGPNGGKVCKDQRLLCVLPDDAISPIFVRIPSTGVGAVSKFIKQVTLQKGIPHYRVVVSLTLGSDISTDGTKYSVPKIEFVGTVSKEEGEIFKILYTDALGASMREAAVDAAE
jgi:hypothetical protein